MKTSTIRRVYLREAQAALTLAGLAIALVPAPRLFAWAARPPRRIARFAAEEVERVAWAIEAATARRRGGASELACSLAAHGMLRRRGVPSRLCLGLEREGGAPRVRAWVEAGQSRLGGTGGASNSIAEFGATRS